MLRLGEVDQQQVAMLTDSSAPVYAYMNGAKYRARIEELEAVVVEDGKWMKGAQAEITRLRAGGCAREQGTTQYCGELQAMVVKLTKLAEKWRVENTYEFDLCADRLDDVIAEREREGER